jgi:hypothetical protein
VATVRPMSSASPFDEIAGVASGCRTHRGS